MTEWVKARRKKGGEVLAKKLPRHIVEKSPLLDIVPSQKKSTPAPAKPSGDAPQKNGEKK